MIGIEELLPVHRSLFGYANGCLSVDIVERALFTKQQLSPDQDQL